MHHLVEQVGRLGQHETARFGIDAAHLARNGPEQAQRRQLVEHNLAGGQRQRILFQGLQGVDNGLCHLFGIASVAAVLLVRLVQQRFSLFGGLQHGGVGFGRTVSLYQCSGELAHPAEGFELRGIQPVGRQREQLFEGSGSTGQLLACLARHLSQFTLQGVDACHVVKQSVQFVLVLQIFVAKEVLHGKGLQVACDVPALVILDVFLHVVAHQSGSALAGLVGAPHTEQHAVDRPAHDLFGVEVHLEATRQVQFVGQV